MFFLKEKKSKCCLWQQLRCIVVLCSQSVTETEYFGKLARRNKTFGWIPPPFPKSNSSIFNVHFKRLQHLTAVRMFCRCRCFLQCYKLQCLKLKGTVHHTIKYPLTVVLFINLGSFGVSCLVLEISVWRVLPSL